MKHQEIIDLYEQSYELQEELFEASKFRNPILKELDGEFLKLKNSKTVKVENIKSIQQLIRKFTGAKYVYLSIKKDMFNAYVIPIYNGFFYKKVKQDQKIIDDGIEDSQYIDKIYITIGQKLLDKLSHKQITAVLLHELGHVYLHRSHVMMFVKKIINLSTVIGTISVNLMTGVFVPIILPLLLISRTFSFFDHKEEYNADKFALKYGYADDISKVMLTFHKKEIQNKSKMRQIFDNIIYMILPTSHPQSKNRIDKINKTYLKKYQKIYPDIKNELTIIFKNLEKS